VTLSDGHSYERRAIERWLAENNTSPMTGAVLTGSDVVPNHALRNSILEHFQAADRQLSPLKPLTPEASADETAPPPAEPVDPEAERSLQEAEQHLQSLDEYVSTASNLPAAPTPPTEMDPEIVRLYEELDADGTGKLNQTELWKLSRKLGSQMDEGEIEQAMLEMDPTSSGAVTLEEFAAWWSQEPEPEPEPRRGGLGADSFLGELPTAIDLAGSRPGTVHSVASGELSARSNASSRMSILSALVENLEAEYKELDWSVFEKSWESLAGDVVFFEDPAEVKEIVALYLRKTGCPPLGSTQINGVEEMFTGWINNARMSGSSGVSVSKAFDLLKAGAKVSTPLRVIALRSLVSAFCLTAGSRSVRSAPSGSIERYCCYCCCCCYINSNTTLTISGASVCVNPAFVRPLEWDLCRKY
jgi:hypothetical protein